jgi:hypothetical protein
MSENVTALKLVGGTQVAPTTTDDPVWEAMKIHVTARTAYSEAVRVEFASEGKVPSRHFARLKHRTQVATDGLMEAGRALLTTRPTTLCGAIAALRYVAAQRDEDDPDDGACPTYLPEEVNDVFWANAFFATIASALITIHGSTS